jgi:hypothetical protein
MPKPGKRRNTAASNIQKKQPRAINFDELQRKHPKNKQIFLYYKGDLECKKYSDEHIKKIIFTKSSLNTVRVLIRLHNEFIALGFNRDQLARVASNDGGSKNLEALKKYWDEVPEDKRTPELRADLVRAVSRNGGSKNLDALRKHWDEAPEDKRTPELRADLVRAVSHDGGSKNLEALKKHWDEVPEDKRTPELRADLVRAVSRNGGSKSLEAFMKSYKQDLLEKHLSSKAVNGCSKSLVYASSSLQAHSVEQPPKHVKSYLPMEMVQTTGLISAGLFPRVSRSDSAHFDALETPFLDTMTDFRSSVSMVESAADNDDAQATLSCIDEFGFELMAELLS